MHLTTCLFIYNLHLAAFKMIIITKLNRIEYDYKFLISSLFCIEDCFYY